MVTVASKPETKINQRIPSSGYCEHRVTGRRYAFVRDADPERDRIIVPIKPTYQYEMSINDFRRYWRLVGGL